MNPILPMLFLSDPSAYVTIKGWCNDESSGRLNGRLKCSYFSRWEDQDWEVIERKVGGYSMFFFQGTEPVVTHGWGSECGFWPRTTTTWWEPESLIACQSHNFAWLMLVLESCACCRCLYGTGRNKWDHENWSVAEVRLIWPYVIWKLLRDENTVS